MFFSAALVYLQLLYTPSSAGAAASRAVAAAAGASATTAWDYRSTHGSKLITADGQTGDQFGYSAAICDDYAFIGAPGDVIGDLEAGSVYMYKWNGADWAFHDKITSDLYMEDESFFGGSIHCQGNVSVVGAHLASMHHESGDEVEECGAVYVYHKDTAGRWSFEAALQSRDPEESEHFGYSVATWDNVVVVGAVGPIDQPSADFYGLVYAYRRELTWENDDFTYRTDENAIVEWILEAIIYPTYAMSVGSFFGISVGIDNGIVAVGSPGSHQRKGGVFLYNRTLTYEANHDDDYVPSYKYLRSIVPDDADNREAFGNSLAMADGKLVVGRYLCKSDDWNLYVGAVHIYSMGVGNSGSLSVDLESVLMEPVAQPQEHGFGYRVSASEGTIVVAASGTHDVDNIIYDPTVYIFGKTEAVDNAHSPYILTNDAGTTHMWSVHAVLRPSDASSSAYGYFGTAIAAGQDGHVFVGDSSAPSSSGFPGAIYAYRGIAVDVPVEGDSARPDSIASSLDAKSQLYIGLAATVASIAALALFISRRHRNKYEGIYDEAVDSSHYDDVDASTGSSAFRDRLQRGIGYLSVHAKNTGNWINSNIANNNNNNRNMPFRYATSEYSDVDEENVMDDSGSSGYSDWRFGGRPRKPMQRGASSVQMSPMKGSAAQRTPQQVMATARAVAADPTHPNRDEVAHLIKSLQKDWITNDKFIDALQELVY